MAELLKGKETKIIAFYLPQFHPIEENDKAHGKGFTEWTKTRKAKPLFNGHYQPRIPLNEDYYNPLDEGVMHRQAILAKKYSVFGFCYYHYWFDGKKLLEEPIEMMLKDKSIDVPFCLSWANENWTKRWDGGNNEIIMKQTYGNKKSWEKHLQYLLPFFRDPRYITYDGSPILIIYKIMMIPRVRKMMRYIRKRMRDLGFKGLVVIGQNPVNYFYGKKNLYDFHIMFEPGFTIEESSFMSKIGSKKIIYDMAIALNSYWLLKRAMDIKVYLSKKSGRKKEKLELRNYDIEWERILARISPDPKLIMGAFTDWDNTPRKKAGRVYEGSTPEKFGQYLEKLVTRIRKENKPNIVFISAWNEWAEGAYLEPDERYGYGYLEAIKRAIIEQGEAQNGGTIKSQ